MPITNKHLEAIDNELELIDNSSKTLSPEVKLKIILSAKEAELDIVNNAIDLYKQIQKNLRIPDTNLKISDKKVNAQLSQYIDIILKDIQKSQENINNGISYQRHTTLTNDSILQSVKDIEEKRTTRIKETQKQYAKPFDYTKTERDDLTQFLLQSVQVWNSIANIKNEDDRSKWYNKLSDNITNLTSTSKNTLYQAGHIMLSITQYGILDVVGKTLQNGVKGFSSGFINTKDKVERGLSYSRILSYSKFVTKHEEKLRDNIKEFSEQNEIDIKDFKNKEIKTIVKEFTNRAAQQLQEIQKLIKIDIPKAKNEVGEYIIVINRLLENPIERPYSLAIQSLNLEYPDKTQEILAIIETQPNNSNSILNNLLSAKQQEISDMTKLQENCKIAYQNLENAQKQITNEYQDYKLLSGLQKTLPAKLGNFVGGVVGASLGVIVAPINALFSLATAGLKNVTIDMPNLISSRYNDNTKDKKWVQSLRASSEQIHKNKKELAQTRFVNKLKLRKMQRNTL